MDNARRSEAAERRDQVRRERVERIAEANLAAKSADHLTYMLKAADDAEPQPERTLVWSDPHSTIVPFRTESGDQ
jgi:hypothetical protein